VSGADPIDTGPGFSTRWRGSGGRCGNIYGNNTSTTRCTEIGRMDPDASPRWRRSRRVCSGSSADDKPSGRAGSSPRLRLIRPSIPRASSSHGPRDRRHPHVPRSDRQRRASPRLASHQRQGRRHMASDRATPRRLPLTVQPSYNDRPCGPRYVQRRPDPAHGHRRVPELIATIVSNGRY
jgi:hypothetical protein